MSYCRFSSDNWRSDVYVYEDCGGGWTTHVAARRRPIPPIPSLSFGNLSMRLFSWAHVPEPHTRANILPLRRCRSWWHELVYRRLWLPFSSWWDRWLHHGSMDLIPLRPIGLPFDGETFNHPTPGECADNLLHLRSLGYHVPQYAIDALLEDAIKPQGND